MLTWLKTQINNVCTAQNLHTENKLLQSKVKRLENTLDIISGCYEDLSKKYFALLVEKPDRYPAVDKQLATGGNSLDAEKAWLVANNAKAEAAKTRRGQ